MDWMRAAGLIGAIGLTRTLFGPGHFACTQPGGARFFAVAAPFPTIADGLRFD
ncbi:hypothetical protein [Candidatus Roseilinea sp. NK_OTU-006]|jgi:hypothetical protein|uniref:hypothetical protein n=1 Tax=Candidatus Roseilinea sp. NK_OTU-006 TaxID=2704250 RepID=UPI00145D12C4|nr:hypothetical protein [Candidatus Roseilinea sp. NK_OTU-006]